MILPDTSLLGRILHTLLGYTDKPTQLQPLAYRHAARHLRPDEAVIAADEDKPAARHQLETHAVRGQMAHAGSSTRHRIA